MCTSIHNYIYIHIHIYTIYYSVNGTIIHMQQWLRSYTLYIHTTYAYILHITHYTLGFGHIHYSYVRVWSTHQVSLKRPIGQWMIYLDHITWVWGVQQWQFIQVYRNKQHTVSQLSSVHTFTCSKVHGQWQHNSESQKGDWVTTCTWWGWEREGVHIWTTLREEQTQDGVNPWTDHSKQPFWGCLHSTAGTVPN